MPPVSPLLADAKSFSLNSAGVAGFFGGKEAISAMATVHLYKGRRWLGWFNSPGSYVIAKRFGRMANSRFWDGLFPGPNDTPAVMFGLDGKKGPKYIAALSGTEMKTGHLAYLTIERSKNMEEDVIDGRQTMPIGITYLAMEPVNYDDPVEREPLRNALLGFIPISVSVVTCIVCAVYHDWYSSSMILLGIISSGLASIIIGRGRLVIKSVDKPASGAPPGHGILIGNDEVVVIKGNEQDVNAITKGHFVVETGPKQIDDNEGVSPKQGDEEKRYCSGRCNCHPERGNEENNIEFQPCGNGEHSGPKRDDEENGIDPKHADQIMFIEEMAGKGKEREVDPLTEVSSDLGTGPEQSNKQEGRIDLKQAGEANFAEEEMAIKRKEREVNLVTEGPPVPEASLKQSNQGINPKWVGERDGIKLMSWGKGEGQEVDIVAEGCSNLETGLKQDNVVKCIDPEQGGEKKATELVPRNERRDDGPEKGYRKSTVEPYNAVGCSSLLLLLQFLFQLILIPQGSLFGQFMFIISLEVSWAYNCYLSSLEKEKVQTDLLFQTLGNPEMRRFRAGTRTTMAVFVCLSLFHGVKCKSLEEKKDLQTRVIRSCVSNDTPVWRRWLDKVMQQILNLDGSDSLPYLQMDKEDQQFSGKDRELSRDLLKDAAAAIRKYLLICDTLPEGSSSSIEEPETTTEQCACDAHCIHCDCNAPI